MLEGAIKKVWGFDVPLFVKIELNYIQVGYLLQRSLAMYKKIDSGKIDLLVNYLSFRSTKKSCDKTWKFL